MKLKKNYLLTIMITLVIFFILFYPRILPTIDVRSTSPVTIKPFKKMKINR